jgi:hypothetical protein
MPKRYGKARTAHNKLVAKLHKSNDGRPGFIGVVTDFQLTNADGSVTKLKPGALFFGGSK